MRIAIAGAHGKIGRRLTRLLVAHGDSVCGLIRNPDHADDVRADGGEPTVCDLESATLPETAMAIEGVDTVVFAAGAGPSSGAERKATMDRDGAIKLLEAAISAGVPGYVMVSAMGTEIPPSGDDVFSVYLRAKADADRALIDSDRQWTIVRPGRLIDEPGRGRVRIARRLPHGEVSRDDVAATLAVVVHEPLAVGRILSVIGGEDPILAALSAELRSDPRGA
ncbi:MAG: SDR family oxidoreductase [Patulibacter sp.]|nr:SDR family oxidoreductase [Patulibacter sp.]